MHADNLQRIGIKLFVDNPSAVQLRDFVPIFHSWIQKQRLDGHLLIDVHDYSHIHHGPGILLVAHEGNISVDMAGGRPGLLYHRKQLLGGTLKERLKSLLGLALQACAMLEAEAALVGKIRFRTDELLLITNDRLLAPNEPATLSRLLPDLSAAFEPVLGKVSVDAGSGSLKDRLSIQIHAAGSKSLRDLLKV